MPRKENLIKGLEKKGVLKSPEIKRALQKVDRAQFVRKEFSASVYEDRPLPIGSGQTISQPLTVVFMLELLSPEKEEKVLDVGAGSGWTTALLAFLVGEKGRVYGTEIVPELVEFGKENLKNMDFPNAEIRKAREKELGLPEEGPYDKILVSAAAEELPQELVGQLKIGGVMVLPIRNSVWKIVKTAEDKTEKKEYKGFAFVPLIS